MVSAKWRPFVSASMCFNMEDILEQGGKGWVQGILEVGVEGADLGCFLGIPGVGVEGADLVDLLHANLILNLNLNWNWNLNLSVAYLEV